MLRVNSQKEGPKPGVTWFNWMNHVFEEKPLEYIEPFLRPVFGRTNHWTYHARTRENFGGCYGEPLREFTLWCEMFALCVDYVSQWDVEKAKKDDAVRTVRVLSAIEGLAAGASTSFAFNLKTNRLYEKESLGRPFCLLCAHVSLGLESRTPRTFVPELQTVFRFLMTLAPVTVHRDVGTPRRRGDLGRAGREDRLRSLFNSRESSKKARRVNVETHRRPSLLVITSFITGNGRRFKAPNPTSERRRAFWV